MKECKGRLVEGILSLRCPTLVYKLPKNIV
jgi:hypothetical protein